MQGSLPTQGFPVFFNTAKITPERTGHNPYQSVFLYENNHKCWHWLGKDNFNPTIKNSLPKSGFPGRVWLDFPPLALVL